MKTSFNTTTEYLEYDILLVSSILRTISHLVVIPTIIALSGFHICSVVYIALICFMQVYRCKVLPTEENLFISDDDFDEDPSTENQKDSSSDHDIPNTDNSITK